MIDTNDTRGIRGDTAAGLADFVDRLFAGLRRADQRARAREYVTGLVVSPGKKTLRHMAATVSTSPHTSQAFQQFLNSSPWDWQPVRQALAAWIEERRPSLARALAPAVLPKRGNCSAGVHRRFVPGMNRTVNCQLGIGMFLVSDTFALPVDWRLALPGEWLDDATRRATTRIPGREVAPAAEDCATDLLRPWLATPRRPPTPPFLVDLTEIPHREDLPSRLTRLTGGFVARVPAHTALLRAAAPEAPRPAAQLAREASRGGALTTSLTTTWRHGPRRVRACRVRTVPDGRRATLLLDESAGERGTTRYLLTDPAPRDPLEAVRLADELRRPGDAVRDMERRCGLRDFEGRSFSGWHRHMTLVSAAYAFRRLALEDDDVPALPVGA